VNVEQDENNYQKSDRERSKKRREYQLINLFHLQLKTFNIKKQAKDSD
jgi:hypothetical protein